MAHHLLTATVVLTCLASAALAGDTTEFCCPDAKKCLTPSTTQCNPGDANACSDPNFPICCPVTKLCVKAGADCAAPSACSSKEFCCPDAKHCLAASDISCAKNSTVCAGLDYHPVCCPLTKLCVKVGAACESPCKKSSTVPSFMAMAPAGDTTEFCCPDAKKCLTPSTTQTQCNPGDANACSDPNFPTCCPLTKLCVKAGADCAAPSVCSSKEFCCPEAKHCLAPSDISCAKDSKACDGNSDYPVCCPLTKLCVKVGATCESPCGKTPGLVV